MPEPGNPVFMRLSSLSRQNRFWRVFSWYPMHRHRNATRVDSRPLSVDSRGMPFQAFGYLDHFDTILPIKKLFASIHTINGKA